MKKVAPVLIAFFLAAGAAAADDDGFFAVGVFGSFGGGSEGVFFNPGLTFRLPGAPVFWGVAFHPCFARDFAGFGVTADWRFLERNLVSCVVVDEEGYTFNLRIDWFVALGGFAHFYFWRDGSGRGGLAFGARVPAGLSWLITPRWELALGLVPAVGLYAGPGGPAVHWSVGGELAARHRFAPRARRDDARNGVAGDGETGLGGDAPRDGENGNGGTHEN